MKFLIIRFSSLGDVVLATVVPRNIRAFDPSSSVDVLTRDTYSEVFYNNPDVNQTLVNVSRKVKYDYIIDIHNNVKSNIIKYFIPAGKRITYNKASYERRLYLKLRIQSDTLRKTVIDRYLEPLEKLNVNLKYFEPKIYLTDKELKDVKKILPKNNYIAIAPGAKWQTKKWPEDSFISLAKKIIIDLKMDIVLLGNKNDVITCRAIKKGVGLLKKHIIDLTAKTNIRELAAVISKSCALVSMDSAPVHVGWAVGSNVVALYGPTVKEFGFQPTANNIAILEKDIKCRPCSLHGSNKCKFKDIACMRQIEVYEVMEKIKKFL